MNVEEENEWLFISFPQKLHFFPQSLEHNAGVKKRDDSNFCKTHYLDLARQL